MKKSAKFRKAAICAAMLILSAAAAAGWRVDALTLTGEAGRAVFALPAANGYRFTTGYTHSVELTPVEDEYAATCGALWNWQERVKSSNAGMPSIAPEHGRYINTDERAAAIWTRGALQNNAGRPPHSRGGKEAARADFSRRARTARKTLKNSSFDKHTDNAADYERGVKRRGAHEGDVSGAARNERGRGCGKQSLHPEKYKIQPKREKSACSDKFRNIPRQQQRCY